MKKNFDNFLENLSQTIGEEQAKELDKKLKIHEEENLSPFLGNCLNYDASFHTKKKRKLSIPVVALLTIFCIFFLFTGGRLVYHFAFEIDQKGDYGIIEASSNDRDFHYTIVPPEGYNAQQEELQNNAPKLVYSNGDYVLVFIESFTETQIDIEDINPKSVFLNTGYEAFYYEKNGYNLYWQQGGYFYYLYTNDPNVDLLELASTVEKT